MGEARVDCVDEYRTREGASYESRVFVYVDSGQILDIVRNEGLTKAKGKMKER